METGDHLPAFEKIDQHGNVRRAEEFKGKPLVVYFYPKDETRGCTAEACSFRDAYQDFQDLGAEVIGVSADSVESHKGFAEHHKLPFVLLSDSDKSLRKAFNVKGEMFGLIPGRETFIFDKEGSLIHKFRSFTNAGKHMEESLEKLKSI